MIPGHGCYARDGSPITMEQWAKSFEDTDARRVALTEFEGGFVSTVWLGLDHRFSSDGPPLIFETMIEIRGEWQDYQERYATEEQALDGHARACEWVRTGRRQLVEEP